MLLLVVMSSYFLVELATTTTNLGVRSSLILVHVFCYWTLTSLVEFIIASLSAVCLAYAVDKADRGLHAPRHPGAYGNAARRVLMRVEWAHTQCGPTGVGGGGGGGGREWGQQSP
jgi:hypothetical protein